LSPPPSSFGVDSNPKLFRFGFFFLFGLGARALIFRFDGKSLKRLYFQAFRSLRERQQG
jgi:hypothetical protein